MIKSLNNGSWQETEMQSWLLAGSSLMNRFVLVVMMVTGDGDDGDDDYDGVDGDDDYDDGDDDDTGLNRAISAGLPSTKIMFTMSLPMCRFLST